MRIRIVRVRENGSTYYEVRKRFLGILWTAQGEDNGFGSRDTYFHTYEEAIKFAEELKQGRQETIILEQQK